MGRILTIKCQGCDTSCKAQPYVTGVLDAMILEGGRALELAEAILNLELVYLQCKKTGKYGLMRIGE